MSEKSTISKWLNGSLDPGTFNKDEDAFIQQLDDALRQKKAPELDVEQALSDINALKNAKPAQKHRSLFNQTWLRYAAAVSLLLISFIVWDPMGFMDQKTYLSAQSGEEIIHYLPDSSRVTVNSASTVSFKAKEWASNRILTLEGEAFFEVKKGSSFTVNTPQGMVEVLGTRFNVRDREGIYEVECYEGKVKVLSQAPATEKILTRGEKLQIINKELTNISSHLEIATRPTWMDDRITFQSVPVSMVIAEIERQFDVTIVTKNINQDQKFTGSFSENNLTIALQTITESLRLQYSITAEQKVLIYSEER